MLIVLVGEERVSKIIHLILMFSLFCTFVLLQIKIVSARVFVCIDCSGWSHPYLAVLATGSGLWLLCCVTGSSRLYHGRDRWRERWKRWIRGLWGEHRGVNKEWRGGNSKKKKKKKMELTVGHLCSSVSVQLSTSFKRCYFAPVGFLPHTCLDHVCCGICGGSLQSTVWWL